MNRGEFQSSLVQQMIWSGTGDGGTSSIMSSLKPCHEEQEASPKLPSLSSPSMLFSQQFPHSPSGLGHINGGTSLLSLHDGSTGTQESHMPESWSQMILSGGLVGDQEREGYNATTALLSKGLENWGDHQAAVSACMVGTKEDGSMPQSVAGGAASYNFYGSHLAGDGHEIQAKSQLSQMLLASSPRSCVTTSLGSNMLDFSNSVAPPPPELRCHHHSDNSSETDTASVLQETIGYVRFLLGQIEALSYPYMGHGSNGSSIQNGPTGESNPGLFPEYPGQLLNHNNNTGGVQQQAPGQPEQQGAVNEEASKKDLRSRGLCLVPVSCTSHFGGDNAADYWAPAPLGGMILQ
ncbi:transcription factor bHLH133-like isoform X7 [Triticum urartu]|uniref:transcription factor bHLH133-like isoform X7 n=1 Tax=Triticum urartu TaxID=4572 RepID=UPI002043B81C|nr:transcription factor bHLH133-like isoform X7 [Triticum urartu]